MKRLHPLTVTTPTSGLIVLHSDGLQSKWRLDDFPGLVNRDVGIIAGVLFAKFRRERDDATIVVVKYSSV